MQTPRRSKCSTVRIFLSPTNWTLTNKRCREFITWSREQWQSVMGSNEYRFTLNSEGGRTSISRREIHALSESVIVWELFGIDIVYTLVKIADDTVISVKYCDENSSSLRHTYYSPNAEFRVDSRTLRLSRKTKFHCYYSQHTHRIFRN